MVLRILIAVASAPAEHGLQAHRLQGLQLAGLVALRHVKSSWTRDRTWVAHVGRQILIHCTTSEVLQVYL